VRAWRRGIADNTEVVSMATMRREKKTERSRTRSRKLLGTMRPPCVLVAEDDDDIRAMIVASLRRDGYDVCEARSGAELLDHIGSSMLFADAYPAPDIIISDIRMPGFTGLEVLAGLRDANWHTPIVLITAYGDEETYHEAERLGADAVFDKPFDVDDLRTAVLNMMPTRAWLRYASLADAAHWD
jgi:CheY-like chemotaxis protein